MQYHEAANIFPIDEDNLQSLADDIKANGQINPIELMGGKILDGRRRWSACQIAGVEPETVEVNPADPVAYALSINLHRRHLDTSQRAMVAARARDYYDRQAKERQREHGDTAPGSKKNTDGKFSISETARDAAGKAVGVSGKTVDFASKVLKTGTPALVKAVDEGRITVSKAAQHATEAPEEQDRIASEPKRPRKASEKPAADEDANETAEPPAVEVRGVGVRRAHEAIACLKRIPQNDALRDRAYQIVLDYITHNRKG